MKIGIMQPYFLPYLGYWQLMNAVDKYIVLDDVNYIKRGWINRNRILLNGKEHVITLPLEKADAFKKISENVIKEVPEALSRTIDLAYHKAPQYAAVRPVIDRILGCAERNLADFVYNSIRAIATYLDIHTEFLRASEISHDPTLHAQDMIIDLCRLQGASEYYNAIGGTELYSGERFAKEGMKLSFVKAKLTPYPQFGGEFVPGLSILDVIMFNPVERIREMLNDFELISPMEGYDA